MGIICGRKVVRTKRGIRETLSSVNIGFEVQSIDGGDDTRKDCPRICAFLKIPQHSCDTYCVSAYNKYVQGLCFMIVNCVCLAKHLCVHIFLCMYVKIIIIMRKIVVWLVGF